MRRYPHYVFDPPSTLAAFLSRFTIDTLIVRHELRLTDWPQIQQQEAAESLRVSRLVLEHASSYTHLVLSFFAITLSPETFRELSLAYGAPSDTLCRCIQKLGKNASRLSVNISTMVVASSPVDQVALRWTQLGTSIAACPALKELCLHVPPPRQAHREWIVAMFAQPAFRNSPLRRIEIHIQLEGSDLDPSTALRSENVHYDWASMDTTLSRARFPRLERVTLSLGSVCPSDPHFQAGTAAAAVLPSMHKAGLLHVVQGW